MANVQLDGSGKVLSYTWNRSIGVDSYGAATRLLKGGPASIALHSYADVNKDIKYIISDDNERTAFTNSLDQAGRPYTVSDDTVKVTYPKGSIYINSSNYVYAGDTAYVNMRSFSLATGGVDEKDLNWYPSSNAQKAGVVGSTGSFQIRPVSDQEILTYHEMCFIKAEVYMRKGLKPEAFTAYRDGIQAHLNMMQAKLTEWQAAQYTDHNPDMAPMDQSAITAYLQSSAVAQGSGDLTMSDIMLQKFIAMGCSIENWNDMRRFNFSAGDVGGFGVVYPGYDRGPLFAGQAIYTGGSKTDPRYWQRRWKLPTALELNYNSANALAMNPHAADPNIWSMPIWWDCATDQEYYGYLQN
jgi:hypothetical protein